MPAIPDGISLFMREEVATLLGGVSLQSVADYVRRHHLTATGQGKARRFPRATVEALQALVGAGSSIETTNGYLRKAKAFCTWLVQSRMMAVNPLAHL
ncbi:MAG: helix-turn-helix domain-containing protein [Gemmataceae bacterium]